ncbi:uncharacterized protein LOC121901165 [Thunnus maccoyii]|uniref:uncharacterized protein LOC121901165 n=1 Tax=Thunnus maccoyii TaxID=8240 RepID=UPI001C4B5731|nr:uncharacterized protein LOC121901165 [Thunnus maccoyii]XP_042273819.1 uncharacterized protein LOC121901165 [Thunnus maccoyii]
MQLQTLMCLSCSASVLMAVFGNISEHKRVLSAVPQAPLFWRDPHGHQRQPVGYDFCLSAWDRSGGSGEAHRPHCTQWPSPLAGHPLINSSPTGHVSLPVPSEFPDLSGIHNEYLDLKDVFNKARATLLPLHCLYDCAVDLLPGIASPKGQLFSLSAPETKTMENIYDSLAARVIYGSEWGQCSLSGLLRIRRFTCVPSSPGRCPLEMLVKKLALEEWRHWLEGVEQPFVVWMDHKNLEYIHSAKWLNSCQARCALFFNCLTLLPTML